MPGRRSRDDRSATGAVVITTTSDDSAIEGLEILA